VPIELLTAREVELRAVDSEHTPTAPGPVVRERLSELRCRPVQHLTEQPRRDLRTRLTERRRRDGLRCRQGQAVRCALVPERIQKMPVAATIRVANHEQQQRDDQLGRQHPVSREVVRSTPVPRVGRCLENRGDQLEEFRNGAFGGTDFALLSACQCTVKTASRDRKPEHAPPRAFVPRFYQAAHRSRSRRLLLTAPFAATTRSYQCRAGGSCTMRSAPVPGRERERARLRARPVTRSADSRICGISRHLQPFRATDGR